MRRKTAGSSRGRYVRNPTRLCEKSGQSVRFSGFRRWFHDGEGGLGGTQHIHAGPARDEAEVRHRPGCELPRGRLTSCEGGSFKPIREMLPYQAFIRAVVGLRAERHFVHEPDDAGLVEHHPQQTPCSIRYVEVSCDPVCRPCKMGEVTTACLERHTGVDRLVLWHGSIMAALADHGLSNQSEVAGTSTQAYPTLAR